MRPWTDLDGGQPVAGVRVSASSTAIGYSAASVLMAETSMPMAGWRSSGETVGAWLALTWPAAHDVHSVSIERPSPAEPGVSSGTLSFGDGSSVQVMLATSSRTTVVPVTPRSTRSVRFTASGVTAGASAVTIDRFQVNAADTAAVHDVDGDATRTARIDASSGSSAVGLAPGGSGWSTPAGTGTTIRFSWAEPRELDEILITGAAGSDATVARATLRFAGGGSVAIGQVPADPSLPTTVAFQPYAVRSATLVIDEVAGPGRLALAGVRLLEHGAPVVGAPAGVSGVSAAAPVAGACDAVPVPALTSALQVLCPQNGSRVGDSATLLVAVPNGGSGVTADVWPASGDVTVPTVTVQGGGVIRVPLRFGGLPTGPVTVLLAATGAQQQTLQLQLLRGNAIGKAAPSSSAARGRTLVYDEEFDHPVSISRTGAGATYAAGKPETDDVADFGSAIFADPAAGLDNIGVLDNRYLRIAVSPKPTDFADPQHFGRTSIGGLIASARPGGSGFSAQYGYFEARMLVPAAPGTWPAFWLLPSTNLITPQQHVAEFDAVELYGHDPTGACESTHGYSGGTDDGVAACGARFPSARAAAQWHTYGVDVRSTEVVFYIDGKQVARAPQVRGGGDPMFFLADLALGGGWPIELTGTQGRAQLLIDSIRVYV